MEGWSPAEWIVEVERMTAMLRSNDVFPFWPELRAQLARQGLDPHEALLVESYDEPPEGVQVGVVVARGGRVLVYRGRPGDLTWSDLTQTWESSEFADQVRVGLTMSA